VGARALPADEAALQAQHYRPVELVGRWRASDTLYLDNRPMDGRPGFVVVTPLLLDDGTAILVQRGWTPRDATRRTQVRTIDTPEDSPVHLSARLAPWPSRLYDLGAEVPGAIRQNVDRVGLQATWGLRLRAATLQQLEPARRESSAGAVLDDGLLRHWPLPAADVHKHYGYAFQWFGMSLLTVGLTVWFAWWKPRRRRSDGSPALADERDR
jgi:surfeit locus 1 family protein